VLLSACALRPEISQPSGSYARRAIDNRFQAKWWRNLAAASGLGVPRSPAPTAAATHRTRPQGVHLAPGFALGQDNVMGHADLPRNLSRDDASFNQVSRTHPTQLHVPWSRRPRECRSADPSVSHETPALQSSTASPAPTEARRYRVLARQACRRTLRESASCPSR